MKTILISIVFFCICDLHAESAANFLTTREQASRIDFATVGNLNRSRGLTYEKLVEKQWRDAGYKVRSTISPNNMGVDRIATRDGKVYFIQAKAYQSARAGARGGLLDALEFHGGAPKTRIPFLEDNTRRFYVSIPEDQYAELKMNGSIREDGTPSQELIQSAISEKENLETKGGLKAVRYRAVAGYEPEIMAKTRFVPGPVAYDKIIGFQGKADLIGSGFGLLLLYTSGHALLADLETPHDDIASNLRIGEHASLFVGGGAMTAAGISEIGSRFATSDRVLSVFSSVSKWGGRTSLAAILIAEPISIGFDYNNWDKMTTGQQIGSVAQHGLNIGSGTYQAYRIYRVSRAAQTLAAGLEAAGAEEVVGDEASVGEIATVGVAPAAIPTQILTQGAVIVTLAGTGFVAGGQYAYDYLHPIPPSWNSSVFSGLSPDQKRQVEDSIYQSYGVAR